MKTFVKMFAVLFVITMSMWMTPTKATAQVAVSFQLFYDQLSPYGSWVSYPNYGYVWLPNAGPGFSPYATAGHWVFTEYGWTWVSDYAWGWAAFHYGRWFFDPFYGWMWVPDTAWGPAWVVWRSSPGYYGWAPLRPGISINVAFGPNYYVPNDWWVFTPCRHITSPVIYKYYAPRSNNVTIINNTTIINRTYIDESQHTTYSYGPDRDQVQKATGMVVKPVVIKQRDKPGEAVSNGQLSIYRPLVQKNYANGNTPEPRKITDIKEVKKREVSSDVAPPRAEKTVAGIDKQPPVKQAPASQREVNPSNNDIKQPREAPQPKKEDTKPKVASPAMNNDKVHAQQSSHHSGTTVKPGNQHQVQPMRSINSKSTAVQLSASTVKQEPVKQQVRTTVPAAEKKTRSDKDRHQGK